MDEEEKLALAAKFILEYDKIVDDIKAIQEINALVNSVDRASRSSLPKHVSAASMNVVTARSHLLESCKQRKFDLVEQLIEKVTDG